MGKTGGEGDKDDERKTQRQGNASAGSGKTGLVLKQDVQL